MKKKTNYYFQRNHLLNFRYKLATNNIFQIDDVYKGDYNYTYADNIPNEIITRDNLSYLIRNIDNTNVQFILQSNDINKWIRYLMEVLSPIILDIPIVAFIPTHRFLEDKEDQKLDNPLYDGRELKRTLAKFQHPVAGMDEDKKKFENIIKLLQSVLNNDNIKMEVTHDQKSILVEIDNKRFPLENLGTGIGQVINIGTYTTANENHIFCIEEPETNLHPELQRKLISYLSKYTNNQYFITTHSSHILETEDTAIFQVQLVDGQSEIVKSITKTEIFAVVHDLGYKASDLLQANCIIWVEGPSDRIYLNYWISNYIEQNKLYEYKEGIHYSIIFYGGRLLSHLTVAEQEVEDFISMLTINRNSSIVMDSDKNSSRKKLNDTKTRIIKEFEAIGSNLVWVTKGREIENYLETQIVQNAITNLYKNRKLKNTSPTKFDKNYELEPKSDNKAEYVDKMKLARTICESKSNINFGYLDLQACIKNLINFIEKSNQ